MKHFLALLFLCAYFYSRSQAVCAGSSTTLTATNPLNFPNPSYSLNPGAFTSPNGVFVVSPNVTTTYTLYTSNGVQTSSVITQVTVNPQPLTNVQVVQPSCTSSLGGFNLNLTFNPANASPAYTVAWSALPNGITNGTQTAASGSVMAGPYTATIMTGGGCVSIVSFTLDPAPEPADFLLTPGGTLQAITCLQPTITLATTEPSFSYTWQSTSSNPQMSGTIFLTGTDVGTWTVTGQNFAGCSKTFTFQVVQNMTAPTSVLSPSTQIITCAQSSIKTVTISGTPSVNITHYVYSPQGGTFASASQTTMYQPGGVGNFTHCLVNLENGCSTCKIFTVTSSQGFPTFSLTSADNFTLGCNSKSVASLSLDDAKGIPPGSPVSYTILAPTSGPLQSGTLSAFSTYTVNTPGTYTAIVHDNTSGCQTRVPFSVLQNTFQPQLTALVPHPILNCTFTTTVLRATSDTKGVSFLWQFAGNPGTSPGNSVTVNIDPAAPTKTLINTYTLVITDNSSTCRSTSVIPMMQNIAPPKAVFVMGQSSLTCATPTIVLTNQSISNISNPFFDKSQPVIGYLWQGPSPQSPLQVSTSYVAATYGIYTLTAKDMNNGCLATTTGSIDDLRDYPILNNPVSPPQEVLDCAAKSTTLSPLITSPTTNLSYTWTGPPTVSLTCQNCRTLTASSTGVYTVIVQNTLNACISTATMSIIQGTLVADFDVSKRSGFAPLTVQVINNSSSSRSKENINSYWSFGNGQAIGSKSTVTTATIAPGTFSLGPGIPATENPSTLYTQPGTYSITLFVTKGACLDTLTKVINVELPSKLEMPNIFSPNDDGVNDVYFVHSNNLTHITLSIIDRWSHIVYQVSSSTGNVLWDGKNQRGAEVAEGIYFYVITATGNDGEEHKQNGTITLVR